MLKTERDDIQVSYDNLSVENNMLQSKVVELEREKATTEEREKQYQMQVAALEEQITSLTASLKDAMEHKTNLQPLKEHVLTQRRKIHQLQICIEEERCKILQRHQIRRNFGHYFIFFGQISRYFGDSNGKNGMDRNK